MDALYIFELNNTMYQFIADPLTYKKCVQIRRISDSNKKWKGYHLHEMKYNHDGLIFLHIKK